MKTDIYKSLTIKSTYLIIESGSQLNELPSTVLSNLGKLEYLKTVDFNPDSPLIAADPKEVIQNIQERGYHIQGTKTTTEISEAGAAIGGGILAASLGFGPLGAIMGAALGAILASSAKEKKNDSDD